MSKELKEESITDNPSTNGNSGSVVGGSSDEFDHLDSKSSSESEDQKVTRSDNESEPEVVDLLDNLLLDISKIAPKTYEQFCHKSYHIYNRLQQWKNQITTLFPLSEFITSDQQKNEIGEFSRDYLDLIQLYANEISPDDKEEISRFNIIFRTWSFCDILYLSGSTDQLNLSKLCDWINIFYNNDKPDDNGKDIDWNYVRRKLLRGDKHTAIQLLTNYADTEGCIYKNEIKKVIEIIKSIPELIQLIPDENGLKASWDKKWIPWHKKTTDVWNEFYDTGVFDDDNDDESAIELRSTLNVLLGDQIAIAEAGTFLEKCIGTLLYTDPTLHNNNLALIADTCYSQPEDDDHIVNMCYALLVGDFDMFIDLMNDDIWYQTHLGYLLLLSGQLPVSFNNIDDDNDDINNNVTVIKEAVTEPIYYVMELYANTIAEEYQMWTESMEYIMACKINKEIWIEKLFDQSSFPSKNIEFLKSLVEFCKKNKLSHVERTLYKMIAQNYETDEDYVNTAINYALAEDVDSLDIMANKLLELYLEKGILQPVVTEKKLEVLDKSKSYVFFRTYHEFKTLLDNNRLDDAYEKLMGLFSLLDINSKYRIVLLVDSIHLQKDCRRMTEQNTQELLQQLEWVRKDSAQQSFISVYYSRCHPSSQPLDSNIIITKIHERLIFNLNVKQLQL